MRNPLTRLGAEGGASEIKSHPWFAQTNWDDVLNKKTFPLEVKPKPAK